MRAQRGLTLLVGAFFLRLCLVPLAYFMPTLTGRAAQLAPLAPLPITFLTMLGFLVIAREKDEARSTMWAQLTAALLSTELLFDCIVAAAPERLAGFDQLPYLVDVLWVAILVTTWSCLRALTTERGASMPMPYTMLFYFAVALRAGMWLQRAYTHRAIDLRSASAAGATALLVSLALPLLELLAAGVARRAGKNSPRAA